MFKRMLPQLGQSEEGLTETFWRDLRPNALGW
jgi:hypothetical protein